jgi:rsbT co-antagonist protein RsbR
MEKDISAFLSGRQDLIIQAWNQKLILEARAFVELAGVEELRSQTRVVLGRLLAALEAEEPVDAETQPDKILVDLNRKMTARHLRPSETVRFIFSLKDVLFSMLAEEYPGENLLAAVSAVNRYADVMAVRIFDAYLAAREEVISEQQRAFQEVSVPVVRIWDKIIMIPLVGMLDSERTQLMMETLLTALDQLQAKVAILDISGIPVVDTLVARHLITTASAVRLMGGECIITGIRARIAQTLVELGVDLSGFLTRTTLADGLEAALGLTKQSIG